jgi:hypothetical protein
MQLLLTKRKYIIERLQVGKQRIITFEMALPSKVKRITGVVFTNTASFYSNRKVGTVSLQSLNADDVFVRVDVFDESNSLSSEQMTGINIANSEPLSSYVTGMVCRRIPLNVDGNTEKVKGWFKPLIDDELDPYEFCIYLEYEELEKTLIETEEGI